VEKFDLLKPDPLEQFNHALHKAHRRTTHPQPSQQWRDKERNERQVDHWLLSGVVPIEHEPEVLQVLKKPDEVYDLSVGPSGIHQAKRSEPWQEVFKVPLNPRYEVRDVQILYLEFLDIGQRGNLAEGTVVKRHCGWPNVAVIAPTDP